MCLLVIAHKSLSPRRHTGAKGYERSIARSNILLRMSTMSDSACALCIKSRLIGVQKIVTRSLDRDAYASATKLILRYDLRCDMSPVSLGVVWSYTAQVDFAHSEEKRCVTSFSFRAYRIIRQQRPPDSTPFSLPPRQHSRAQKSICARRRMRACTGRFLACSVAPLSIDTPEQTSTPGHPSTEPIFRARSRSASRDPREAERLKVADGSHEGAASAARSEREVRNPG